MNDDIKKHFKDGVMPRLELSMLPRDNNRSTGTMRKVLCATFNYCRRYNAKLDLFIKILRFVVNFALAYQHFLEEKRLEAVEVEAEEERMEQLAAEERMKRAAAEEETKGGDE